MAALLCCVCLWLLVRLLRKKRKKDEKVKTTVEKVQSEAKGCNGVNDGGWKSSFPRLGPLPPFKAAAIALPTPPLLPCTGQPTLFPPTSAATQIGLGTAADTDACMQSQQATRRVKRSAPSAPLLQGSTPPPHLVPKTAHARNLPALQHSFPNLRHPLLPPLKTASSRISNANSFPKTDFAIQEPKNPTSAVFN